MGWILISKIAPVSEEELKAVLDISENPKKDLEIMYQCLPGNYKLSFDVFFTLANEFGWTPSEYDQYKFAENATLNMSYKTFKIDKMLLDKLEKANELGGYDFSKMISKVNNILGYR